MNKSPLSQEEKTLRQSYVIAKLHGYLNQLEPLATLEQCNYKSTLFYCQHLEQEYQRRLPKEEQETDRARVDAALAELRATLEAEQAEPTGSQEPEQQTTNPTPALTEATQGQVFADPTPHKGNVDQAPHSAQPEKPTPPGIFSGENRHCINKTGDKAPYLPQNASKGELDQITVQGKDRATQGQPEAGEAIPLAEPDQTQPDVDDWLTADIEADIEARSNDPLPEPKRQAEGAQAGQDENQEQERPSPFALLDVANGSGAFYMDNPAPKIKTIFAGMVRGTLGGIVAAPGTGKSTMLAQAVAIAGGAPWLDVWEIIEPLRVLILFAEDPAEIVHTRIKNAMRALPDWARDKARENFFAFPLRGNVALIDDVAGIARLTKAFDDFRRLVDEIKPDLIFLDTYARFVALSNENNNAAITTALSFLDDYCYETGISIILTHHTDKLHSRSGVDKAHLHNVLSQVSARGGTGFAASVRWLLTMVPLQAALAGEIISDNAKNFADGTFVAMKVTKTNYGRQGGTFYFQHMDNGLFVPVEPEKQEKRLATVQDDAARLVEIVQGRAKEGIDPLSFSKGIAGLALYSDQATGKPWGTSRYNNARQYAVDNGLLVSAKKNKGNGLILSLPEDMDSLLDVTE